MVSMQAFLCLTTQMNTLSQVDMEDGVEVDVN
jgi:hypothetical protein